MKALLRVPSFLDPKNGGAIENLVVTFMPFAMYYENRPGEWPHLSQRPRTHPYQ